MDKKGINKLLTVNSDKKGCTSGYWLPLTGYYCQVVNFN
jgi:hypothetical protein